MNAADGIAAVVVAYNSESTLDVCLLRLRAGTGVRAIRVVDNASTDSTMQIVQRHALDDPRVRFIANPDNPGFAVACNQGAADAEAPWLAFVNPDCFVEGDTLARLRRHAASLDGGLLGASLVGEDGVRDPASRRRDPDFAAMLRAPSRRDLSVADDGSPLQRVDAVSGGLMLLPRALFDAVGGFDEGYRLHAEDLDLCRRVRRAGAVVACANDVVVTHVRGVSSASRPLFVEWHKHRGLWRYFRRFDAARHGVVVRAAVFAMIWTRFAVAVSAKMLRRIMGSDD